MSTTTAKGPLDEPVKIEEMRDVLRRVTADYDRNRLFAVNADGIARVQHEVIRDIYVLDMIDHHVLRPISTDPKSFQDWARRR